MQPIRSASLAALLLVPCLAVAQPVTKSVSGKAGEEIRVAVLGTPRPDCTAGPRPEVKLLNPASNGQVRLGPRTLRTTRVNNCPAMELPVIVVSYTSRLGFVGTDRFEFEANLGTVVQRQTVTVDIQAAL
jgi:hypothetical protein